MQAEVTDNRHRSRFELERNGLTAILEYRRTGNGPVLLTHTQVPDELSGHGVGSRLVRGALDELRARGMRIVPLCSFVAAFVARHSEYEDMLADQA